MDSRLSRKLIEDTAKKISQLAPGTIITHIQIGDFLGVEYKSDNKREESRYYNYVTKVKNVLESDYGYFLESETKVGYRITLRGEEINACEGKFRQGVKRMWKAVKSMSNIRVDLIKDESKRTATISRSQHLANIAGMARAGLAGKEPGSGGLLK